MYQFDSEHQWISSPLSEGKVFTTPLEQEASDYQEGKTVNDGEVNSESNFTKTLSERQLEEWISNLLKSGVLLSSTIVLVGGIQYLIYQGGDPAEYQFFRGEPFTLCSLKGVVTAAFSSSPLGIIQLGLLLLIATPIVRVAFSLLVFLWQRNFTYVVITLLVLSGLIYSITGAYY